MRIESLPIVRMLIGSVRGRLLTLCLGLVVVLGGANLLLGFLVTQNGDTQHALQEQYRRLEVIQETGRALALYRHSDGERTSHVLLKDPKWREITEPPVQQSLQSLEGRLHEMAEFDPRTASTILDALREIPEYHDRMLAAIIDGHLERAGPDGREMQKRLDIIEASLSQAARQLQGVGEAIQTREQERVLKAIWLARIITLLTGFAGLTLTIMVVRSILRPLQSTVVTIRQLNAGLTNVELPPVTADEFGDIALALRHLRESSESLRKRAFDDSLTGLGNRTLLEERLDDAVRRCRSTDARLALFYMDIDNFRAINDRFGHKLGDRYLCETVARLQTILPPDALLCRYGGDKFTVLIEGLHDGAMLTRTLRDLAGTILRGLAEPYVVGEDVMSSSVSIGIAVFPQDGETVEQIVSAADAAMFAAKQNGRNNSRFASSQTTGHYRRRLALADDIRRGIEAEEFLPFYQPIIDIERGAVVSAEALLRWRHPQRGLLQPGEFIEVAEEFGLIQTLGEQCLRAAHAQARRWLASGRHMQIAVNLSARQVHDGGILRVLNDLELESLPTNVQSYIDFELTESTLLDRSEQGRTVLEQLSVRGYRLGLDDFGTGYSSFSYLRRLPIAKIKIDRQFVSTLSSSRQSVAIVSAIVALARSLNLEVIAEGIETDEQMWLVRRLGCSNLQGYYFSRALPADEFESWVSAYERRASLALGDGTVRPVA